MDFITLKKQFENATTDEKIKLYTTAEGLTQEQYRELLRLFPYSEIGKLEKALQG